MMILIDSKKIGKIWRKMLIFWPKISIFLFAGSIFHQQFSSKSLCVSRKMVKFAKFLVYMFLGVLTTIIGPIFLIFGVLAILGARVCVERAFFCKKRPKKPPLVHTGAHKMTKTPNIKKMGPIVVVSTLRNIYTKNQVNWTIFLEMAKLLPENRETKIGT